MSPKLGEVRAERDEAMVHRRLNDLPRVMQSVTGRTKNRSEVADLLHL